MAEPTEESRVKLSAEEMKQLVEQVYVEIQNTEDRILQLKQTIDDANNIIGKLQFYIGNENLQIKLEILVNLHKIDTKILLNTKVKQYKEHLTNAIVESNKTLGQAEEHIAKLKNVIDSIQAEPKIIEDEEVLKDDMDDNHDTSSSVSD